MHAAAARSRQGLLRGRHVWEERAQESGDQRGLVSLCFVQSCPVQALRDLFALTADEIDEVERRGLRFSTRDPMTVGVLHVVV